MVATKLKQMNIGVSPQTNTDGALLCACTLQTGSKAADGRKIVIGCMLKVYMRVTSTNTAVKLITRTPSEKVTSHLTSTLAKHM